MPVDTRPQKAEPRSASGPREIVEEYFMDVYGVCFRVLGHPHDAEDATQETFLALFRDPGKLTSAASARAWVLTVARNTAVSLFRTRRREKPLEAAPVPAAPIPEPVDPERLHEALAFLSDDERHLVQLRFLEEKGPAEMAAATGKSPGTVATALCRALQKLRDLYQGGGSR